MTSPALVDRWSSALPAVSARPVDGYHPVFNLAQLVEQATDSIARADSTEDAESRDALLDAYLFAASICQVVSDHAHRDVGDLRRVARYASRLPGPAGIAAVRLVRGSATVGHGIVAMRERQLARWLADVEEFTGELADVLWGGDKDRDPKSRRKRWAALIAGAPPLPEQAIAVPPRCFFSFDQRPVDCIELAERFAAMHPDRKHPVLVVGVRTSGCFLAPIVASALRRLGFHRVDWTSWRHARPTLYGDRTLVRRISSEGGRALVVDDPPTSGGSFARTASELVAAGFERDQVTLLLPLFSGERRWERELRGWEAIELGWDEWDIQRRLDERAVARDLRAILPGQILSDRRPSGSPRHVRIAAVKGVRRLQMSCEGDSEQSRLARKHVRAEYGVEVLADDGSSLEHHVLAQGVGLGMFGSRAAAAAARLDGLVPRVFAVTDGLMYQEVMPSALAVDESEAGRRQLLARGLARYAARRAAALPVSSDEYLQTSGHDALWEQASRWLGEGFGRLALPLRPALHTRGRRLLRTGRVSLIDGSMGPGHWFIDGSEVIKDDWDEGAYAYQIPYCYDAAFDVAAAASERLPDESFGDVARREFEAATGAPIDAVRWFLYQLLSELDRHAAVIRKAPASGRPSVPMIDVMTEGERRAASLHRAFLSRAYLADAEVRPEGELVAIDIDGVLESARWSYPTPSVDSLGALRALQAHGYRPVIATGRSLDESIRRCRDYRMAGAVAEYGSAVYDASTHRVEVLVDDRALADLDALRGVLAGQPEVAFDAAFRHSVRAFVVRRGRRRALPAEVAELAVARAGVEGRVRIVQGWAQTDFIAEGIDKGSGLKVLAGLLGVRHERPLALAVGDSAPDLPMLELARIAAAPANADERLFTAGYRRCKGVYGAGLADAAAILVGHTPGSCPACAPPPIKDPDAHLLLALLRVADRQGLGKLAAIAEAFRL